MAKRVAFFASKEEVETYFNIQTDKKSLFEPHYNLSPGHQLPVLMIQDGESEIKPVRWGKMESNQAKETTIEKENLPDVFDDGKAKRCVLPLSGFFIWKDDKEKNHPFFVRLLNNPVMSIAGIYIEDEEPHISILTTESNALVHPMSKRMPLLLNRAVALQWLEPAIDTNELLEQAENLYMLNDLSVLRVSKKVNDPTNNNPQIIQPIPK